jgi:hypothetical protein
MISDAPEFLTSPLTQFDVIEGQSSLINLTARGNPSTIQYKWSRQPDTGAADGTTGAPIDSVRIQTDGPILNISQALRSDSGVYKLFAQNELGFSETAIKVNVHCIPSFTIYSVLSLGFNVLSFFVSQTQHRYSK